jgi:hypothetical protein
VNFRKKYIGKKCFFKITMVVEARQLATWQCAALSTNLEARAGQPGYAAYLAKAARDRGEEKI